MPLDKLAAEAGKVRKEAAALYCCILEHERADGRATTATAKIRECLAV